jgi:carboxyl-terminal processing protease
MSPTPAERKKILEQIKRLVPAKHINVANLNQDYSAWLALANERTASIIQAPSRADFEAGVRDLLSALGSSHTAFFHANGNDVPPPYAVNATLRATDTAGGKRWMFLDVIEEGVAARAGIRPGEFLLALDSNPIAPPERPVFHIGRTHRLMLGNLDGTAVREVEIEVPNKAAKDRPPMVEPRSVSHRMIESEIGYVRVATFPGAVGVDFARDLDAAIADLKRLGCTRLIVDLRGNVGGGLGSLRLMSYLCPGKLPVGYSLTRYRLRKGFRKEKLTRIDKIPSNKAALLLMALRFLVLQRDRSMALVTEGLGPQPFHGRIVVLINGFTHSAAEMVASFALENDVATLVGTRTSGEVLGGANFGLAARYRLRMPIAGWYTWSDLCIEGTGIHPGVEAESLAQELATGVDSQLSVAVQTVRELQT